MAFKDGTLSGSAPVPVHFPTTIHIEENTFYWGGMPNGTNQDHWFWGGRFTAPVAKSYSVPLANVSTAITTGTVRISIKGRTDILTLDPDHHTKIYVNSLDAICSNKKRPQTN